MELQNEFIPRAAFPQLPWRRVENPKYIQTKHGNKLLISGWWAYLRKPVRHLPLCPLSCQSHLYLWTICMVVRYTNYVNLHRVVIRQNYTADLIQSFTWSVPCLIASLPTNSLP